MSDRVLREGAFGIVALALWAGGVATLNAQVSETDKSKPVLKNRPVEVQQSVPSRVGEVLKGYLAEKAQQTVQRSVEEKVKRLQESIPASAAEAVQAVEQQVAPQLRKVEVLVQELDGAELQQKARKLADGVYEMSIELVDNLELGGPKKQGMAVASDEMRQRYAELANKIARTLPAQELAAEIVRLEKRIEESQASARIRQLEKELGDVVKDFPNTLAASRATSALNILKSTVYSSPYGPNGYFSPGAPYGNNNYLTPSTAPAYYPQSLPNGSQNRQPTPGGYPSGPAPSRYNVPTSPYVPNKAGTKIRSGATKEWKPLTKSSSKPATYNLKGAGDSPASDSKPADKQ